MTSVARASDPRPSGAPGRRHYARAPIQEALVDIKVTQPPLSDPSALERIAEGRREQYPQSTALPQSSGYQFYDPRTNEILRVRADGYSYHKLEPYTHWEDWTERVFEFWSRYRQMAPAAQVIAMSVRYVNRVEIPAPANLEEYFSTTPQLGPGLPQLLSNFSMQLHMPLEEEEGAELVIRQGTAPSRRIGVGTIVLDLEVTKRGAWGASSPEIRSVIERLHEFEIEAFERCITNRTRELIA